MRTFSTSIDIAASTDRVWQVMSDTDAWREWTPSVTSVKRLGDRPFAVDTRVLIRQPKFPPALWKVTAIERGRSFTWVSTAPGLRVTGHHAVEPGGTGSRATLSLRLEGLFSGLFAALTGSITQRYIGLEAAGLKARSENPVFRHRPNVPR
ncbi:MAG: hypothetical protein V7647_3311 [Acidobacteriota bacterium]|jgi:carbon monoxide dehydrogenase subunit G